MPCILVALLQFLNDTGYRVFFRSDGVVCEDNLISYFKTVCIGIIMSGLLRYDSKIKDHAGHLCMVLV